MSKQSKLNEALSTCGMMPNGYCTLYGTEHCDFDCPIRDMKQCHTCGDYHSNEGQICDNCPSNGD